MILACLAKSPEQRPASAQVLRAALLACADAARYDPAVARVWWDEHAERLKRTTVTRDVPAATIAIDLSQRRVG